jgi:hypothetical protein
MAIRPLIARPVRFSASIPEGNRCEIRSSKYLNNLIEQDHRSIKLWLGPMLGFKRFRGAATTIAGIELMHRIRKGQFKLRVKNKTRLRFGMQRLARDPRQAPERFLALISSICTTAVAMRLRSHLRWCRHAQLGATYRLLHDRPRAPTPLLNSQNVAKRIASHTAMRSFIPTFSETMRLFNRFGEHDLSDTPRILAVPPQADGRHIIL